MQIAWRWPDAAMGLDPARMQGCNPGRSRTNLQFLRDDGNRHMLQTRLWLNGRCSRCDGCAVSRRGAERENRIMSDPRSPESDSEHVPTACADLDRTPIADTLARASVSTDVIAAATAAAAADPRRQGRASGPGPAVTVQLLSGGPAGREHRASDSGLPESLALYLARPHSHSTSMSAASRHWHGHWHASTQASSLARGAAGRKTWILIESIMIGPGAARRP